jgi:hypothetical protein
MEILVNILILMIYHHQLKNFKLNKMIWKMKKKMRRKRRKRRMKKKMKMMRRRFVLVSK